MNIKLDNKYISYIQKLFFISAILFVIAQFSKLFLPSYGVSISQSDIKPIIYQKYSIFDTKSKLATPEIKKEIIIASSISKFKLKALIYEGKYNGYIIVQDTGSTEVLSIGDTYKGYRLKSLTKDSAIFIKDGELSSLFMSKEWEDTNTRKTIPSNNNYQSIYKDNSYEIKKRDIRNYAKNPKLIWKNIRIIPTKKDGKLIGYKVNSVKKNSVFAQLGIKKGDLITKVNNIVLKSNKDAINLYKNIDNMDNILITIDRDGAELELEYELQ